MISGFVIEKVGLRLEVGLEVVKSGYYPALTLFYLIESLLHGHPIPPEKVRTKCRDRLWRCFCHQAPDLHPPLFHGIPRNPTVVRLTGPTGNG